MKKGFLAVLAVMMSVMLFACNSNTSSVSKQDNSSSAKSTTNESKNAKTSYPLSIKDDKGKEVVIDKEPQKIVSLAPSATEAVFALGRGDRLVGRTDYCTYPAEASSIESIGTITAPNVEKVVSLKPDIVIASPLQKDDVLKKFEDLGIKVVTLYKTESFEGTYDALSKIGQVLNAQDKANEVVSNMKEKVKEITSKVEGKAKSSVYYVVSYGEFGDYTAGKDTFISNMIEMAGGTNVADDVTSWSKYSTEKILEKNPDIVICDNFQGTKEGITAANGYKDLKAVKDGKLMTIDINTVQIQGPRLVEGLESLAKIIHPELFK